MVEGGLVLLLNDETISHRPVLKPLVIQYFFFVISEGLENGISCFFLPVVRAEGL